MQVSDNFGPIYQSVVLDGNGNGGVSFQATGSNVRLSNIFFRVSTANNQAVCTIYKGQIADGNRVFNSNSGSTGANATGNVDLFDGETCYVVWTGGDAGSTATATFTGGKISFNEIQPANLTAQDPVAAGDGTLIFPALKSPNYVAGTSGWFLSRDGDIELNTAVVRGELIVTGENNEYIRIYTTNVDNAQIELGLPDNIGTTRLPALITTSPVITGVPSLIFRSPSVDGTPQSQISMIADTANDQSDIYIDATDIAITGESEVAIYGGSSVRIQNNAGAVGQFIVDTSVDESIFENNVIINGSFSRPNVTVTFGTPSIPTGGAAGTVITSTAVLDSYGMVSGGTIVIPRDGMWDVNLVTQFAPQAASVGFRQHYIYVNGVEVIQHRENASVNFNNAPVCVNTTYALDLNSGDVVTFGCYQTSGGALTITNASQAFVSLREG